MSYFNHSKAAQIVAQYAAQEGLDKNGHTINIDVNEWSIKHQSAVLQVLIDEAMVGDKFFLASEIFGECQENDLFLNVADPARFGEMWIIYAIQYLHDELALISDEATHLAKVNDAHDAWLRDQELRQAALGE